MIGRVDFRDWRPPAYAVMGDDLTWESPEGPLSTLLNTDPRFNWSGIAEADGQPGRMKVMEAARALGGVVTWPETVPSAYPDALGPVPDPKPLERLGERLGVDLTSGGGRG